MCQSCFDDVEDFNKKNYIWIDNITDIDDNDIIDKWPLLNDDSLHKKIQSFTQQNEEIEFSEQIRLIFDNLKEEIIKKIEDVKKQLINASQQLPNHQNQLIEEIKKISQTNILKQIFTDSKQNYKQIEDKLREFIKFESQKQNNTEIVNNLIKEYQQNLQIYDLKTRRLFNSSFYHLIEEVDQFFQKNYTISYSYDILPEIQVIKTNYQQSQQQLQIVKSLNNQISISQNIDSSWTNCVSDFILDENTNYVFRFQFISNYQSPKEAMIGLVRDSQKDPYDGSDDCLSCYFYIHDNSFYHGNFGIDKKEKGDFSVLRQDQKEIEMRVCIKEGILQILDYPNYNHILSITDEHIIKLIQYKNLRLNISLYYKDLNINLIEAYECLSFN